MTSWIDQSRLNDALKAIEPIQKIVFEEKRFQSIRGVKREDIYDRQLVLLAKQALLRLTADITEQKAVDAELEKLGLSEKEALKRLDAQPVKNQNNTADAAQKELQANNEKHYADIQKSGPISDIPLTEFLCKDPHGNFIYDDKIENREPQIHPRVREQFNKTKEALQKLLLASTKSKNIKEHLDELQPQFFRLELFLMVFTANLEKAILNAKLLHAKNQLDTVVPDLAVKNAQLKQQKIDLERLQAVEINLTTEMTQQARELATLERDNAALSEEKNTLAAEVKKLQAEKNEIEGDYRAYERDFDTKNLATHALQTKINNNEALLRGLITPFIQNQWLHWTAISLIALVSVGLLTTGIMALAGAPILPGLGLIYGISTTIAGSLLAYFASEAYLKECVLANNLPRIDEAIEDLGNAPEENKAENEDQSEPDHDNRFHSVENPANYATLKDFVYITETDSHKPETAYFPLSYFGYLGSLFATSKAPEEADFLSPQNSENPTLDSAGALPQNPGQR